MRGSFLCAFEQATLGVVDSHRQLERAVLGVVSRHIDAGALRKSSRPLTYPPEMAGMIDSSSPGPIGVVSPSRSRTLSAPTKRLT